MVITEDVSGQKQLTATVGPLPTPPLDSLYVLTLQVDDDDKSDLDDDELEAINAAGAGGQTTGDGNNTTSGDATVKDGDAKQTKSVRMNIGGELRGVC
jgi:hypothetical protein